MFGNYIDTNNIKMSFVYAGKNKQTQIQVNPVGRITAQWHIFSNGSYVYVYYLHLILWN